MKKSVILILGLSLALTSCTIDWKDENKAKIEKLEKQVTELKKEKEDDLFKKKQECSKLTNMLITRTNEISKEFPTQWKFSFEQVFYSIKYNNCLWIRIKTKELNNGWSIIHKSLYEIWNDSGSSEPIYWCDMWYLTNDPLINTSSCNDFDNKIKELKWE